MKKAPIFGLFFLFILRGLLTPLTAQNPQVFEAPYTLFEDMLSGKRPIDFKKAVFMVEKAFLEDQLDEQDFEAEIAKLLTIVQARNKYVQIDYTGKDADRIKLYSCIFKTLTDTTFVKLDGETLFLLPYRYNFDDMFGQKDWSNVFVSKLLTTHLGNCHSLPYLYKILCDALKIPCNLALAPSHIYIKHRSEKLGWYNTELTSATFPSDAWLMASAYISLPSIQNGLYMDALDDKKALTLCVYDLAKNYNRKYPQNDGVFIIKCCDLALKYFPNSINALMLKAETLKQQFKNRNLKLETSNSKFKTLNSKLEKDPSVSNPKKAEKRLLDEMTSLYAQMHTLGYRAMPKKMYDDWMASLKKEREKYINK